MKFTYTAIYQEMIPSNSLALAYENAKKGIYEPPKITVWVGSKFVADDDSELMISNYEPHRNDPAYIRMMAMRDLAGYFGGHCNSECYVDDDGVYEDWTDDFDKDVNVYYYLTDGEPMKMIVTLQSGMHLRNNLQMGKDYYGCVDGKVTSVTPENGDIVFDNMEELLDYKRKTKKNDKKKEKNNDKR